MSNKDNNENDKKSKIPFLTLRWFFICFFFFFLLFLFYNFLRFQTKEEPIVEPEYTPAPTATAVPTAPPTPTPEPTPSPTPSPDPLPTPKIIQEEFRALREEYDNYDIVGYLKIPDTTIDYLVLQSDDNAYYLERDIYKKKSSAGWIFMDYENDVQKDDKNIILYGHNMNKDYMFHSIRKFNDENFYKLHKTFEFSTIYEDYTCEIFSYYRTNIDFYFIQVLFKDNEDFLALVNQMKSKSMYDTGVEVTKDDRIITLSTCTNDDPNWRYVVNAKLIKKEKKASDTNLN